MVNTTPGPGQTTPPLRPPEDGTDPGDDEPGDGTKVPKDDHGGHVSSDPHPADCAACETAPYKEARGCDTVVGTPLPCEGACAVRDGVEPVWMHEPPHSGPHSQSREWHWGEHTEVVPRGQWVHNLRHGFVVLLYNCPAGCNDELEVLRNVLRARGGYRILLTPDPLLSGPRFAAVAWTWVYQTDTPDLATLVCFVDQHERQGAEHERANLLR